LIEIEYLLRIYISHKPDIL